MRISTVLAGPGCLFPQKIRLSLASVILICVGAYTEASAEEEPNYKDLAAMSLEELMNVDIRSPAALTRLEPGESPASLTSLTSDDIQRTPARNLMDLIEIYVPGAIWMNFEEGPLVGIRGSVSGFNNKYLLIVNGKVLSSKGIFGGKSELELWDLGDIKRLDIIRGPGSVTYGPSAVAGVISITTHDARSLPRTQVSAGYVHEYGSTGGTLSQGAVFKDLGFLAYASVRRTTGYSPLNYQGSNDNQPGYQGLDIQRQGQPLDYFADYQDIPQAKLYGELRFLKNWNLWARYTQQGATWSGNESKSLFNGELINQQSLRDRQFSSSIEFVRELNPRLEIQAKAGALLFDVERRADDIQGAGPGDPQNFRYNYSESEYIAGTRVNYRPTDWFEAAAGSDMALEQTGPGWGEGSGTMITGGDGIIISGPESRVLGPGRNVEAPVFAGDGWSTRTFSAYVETKAQAGAWPTLLLSGRADKNTHSQWLLSPRVALIGNLPKQQILKGIFQRSMHRNESGELFIENQRGTRPSYETQNSYEMIHQARLSERIASTLSVFYNDADVVAWNPVVDRSLPVGNLKLAGMEAELAWNIKDGRCGANYSMLQLIDWDMAPGVTSSGVSYSDYNQALRNSDVVQTGYGKDLNNWPNQAFKVFGNMPLADNFALHADAQMFWDYRGSKDGLAALERAAQGDSLEQLVEEAVGKVRDEDVFGLNSRINVSAHYAPVARVKFSLFVLNLLGTETNQRHAFDEGNNRLSPHRVRFIREERAVGIRLACSL
jgi:outer membrane receptor protein involved in Fe transport